MITPTLSLTKEEIALLLQVSTMDVYADYSGGPDVRHQTCPLCNAYISDDDKVSNYVSEEFFNREILPSLNKDGWGEYYNYNDILIYEINDFNIIPFPHKEGCKIEVLRAIHKKMQNFVGSSE
jgi:hypothetical protein